jgi:hypothetical protein
MMRHEKTLTRSDLIVRGLFLAVVVIGGIVGWLQQIEAAPEDGAGAPVVAANIGMVLPAVPTCQSNVSNMPPPSVRPDGTANGDAGKRRTLSGSVRSSAGCMPIGGAKIEFWPSGEDAADDRAKRAPLFADANGKYRLQCDLPAADGAYIYLRVSADGYATLTTQYQPEPSQAESEFDIVLEPEK